MQDVHGSTGTRGTTPRVGLALGAGAARGLAHIGVLQQLSAMGLRPDTLAGCSIGAAVAVSHAAGRLDNLAAAMRGISWLQVARLVDLSLNGGLIDRGRLADFLSDVLGDAALEDLSVPVIVVTTDMDTGREVWLRTGPAVEAVAASIAMPGLLPPVRREGRWLLDGAMSNPLPVSAARSSGADILLAASLGTLPWEQATPPPAPARTEAVTDRQGWLAALRSRTGQARIEPRRTWRQPGETDETSPGVLDVVFRSVVATQDLLERLRLAIDPCDVLINPQVRDVGLFQFDRADDLIAAGQAAVRDASPAINAMTGQD